MRVINNIKVDWRSDNSARVEIGERLFVCSDVWEKGILSIFDRRAEDEVVKWLLEGGWSEVGMEVGE